MSTPWIVAFLALALLVVVQAIVLLGFLRRALVILEAAESRLRGGSLPIGGASPGTEIPSFEIRDAEGRLRTWSELLGAPAVVLFASADCHACHLLLEELNARGWSEGDARLIAILNDSVEDRALTFGGGVLALYQGERSAAAAAFESIATPQAFAVDSSGIIVDSRIPQFIDDLRRLAQSLEGGEGIAPRQLLEVLRA